MAAADLAPRRHSAWLVGSRVLRGASGVHTRGFRPHLPGLQLPRVNEDEAWSVALACACLFVLVGIIERQSWRRVILCGVLVLLTNLNRSTTGYPAILATVLLAGWFGLGRAGPDRRSWAVPLMGAALVPLGIGCAIDEAKFGLLLGVPFSDQLVFREFSLGKEQRGRLHQPSLAPLHAARVY